MLNYNTRPNQYGRYGLDNENQTSVEYAGAKFVLEVYSRKYTTHCQEVYLQIVIEVGGLVIYK